MLCQLGDTGCLGRVNGHVSAKARSPSFPFVQAERHPVFAPDRRAGYVHTIFGTGNMAVKSPILCTVRFYVQRPVEVRESCVCKGDVMGGGLFSNANMCTSRRGYVPIVGQINIIA